MIAMLCFATCARAANGSWSVTSPDGHVEIRIFESQENALQYEVKFRGQSIIEPSQLQFTVDGAELTADVQPAKVTRSKISETYPWRGGHSIATNQANAAAIFFQKSRAALGFTLEVRAADDGVAFRYLVPGDQRNRVPDENDSFRLPANSVVWYHDHKGHYEGVHQKKNLAEISSGDWAMPPVTFQLPNGRGYASIT
jgi:alpha-glucosidase